MNNIYHDKIFFFNSSMGVGGVPRVISLWSDYFINHGCQVNTVSNISKEIFYVFNKKVEHHALNIDQFKQKNPLKALFLLYKFLKKNNDCLCIFNKGMYIPYLFILKKFKLISSDIKLVYFIHGGSSDLKTMVDNFHGYMILKTFNNIIALHDDYDKNNVKFSIGSKRWLIDKLFKNNWQILRKMIIYIPNPVSFKSTKTPNYYQKQIVAVGKLDYIKGFDLLINSWANISKFFIDWHLKILGDGPDYYYLQKLIDNSDVNNISILPATREIKSIYEDSSIYAMSSRAEGMPMVLLEAMECGLPIVAYANVGAKYLVENKVNGILCELGDNSAFDAGLMKLMSDVNLRIEYGRNSKKLITSFYIENLGSKWEPILIK